MREIKFRAWNTKTNKMYYEIRLLLPDMVDSNGQFKNTGYCEYYEKPDIFMQYTGLKDCKQVEIYEGDIVRCLILSDYDEFVYKIGQVLYFGKYSTLCIKVDEFIYEMAEDIETPDDFEVIGNIYQNRELI